jgi:hypothetical protein
LFIFFVLPYIKKKRDCCPGFPVRLIGKPGFY